VVAVNNLLEKPTVTLAGLGKPKPKRKPVTLIVGIICKDGIVVASDSQTTWETGKSWDRTKMTVLEYPYGRALLAQSGAAITSSNVAEQMQKLAENRELFDAQEMRGIAALAVKKVREQLRFQNFDCSSEELQSVIERNDLDSALMIAHYEGDKPRLDTIRFKLGVANRAQSFFEAIGTGADLATYLLTDLCTVEMDYRTASVHAVYVIEIVKRHDPYCGGPTKLGVLNLPEYKSPYEQALAPAELEGPTRGLLQLMTFCYVPPILLSQSETDEIVQMALEVEQATRKQRAEIVRRALRDKSKRRMEELMTSVDGIIGGPKAYPARKAEQKADENQKH
jgi:hypothetical protein